MSKTWVDFDGEPLKFQDGDYVRIDISDYPWAVHTLPFLEGYVRGFDMSQADGVTRVAYTLHKMGHNPLVGVKEEGLAKAPEALPHTCHGRVCGICGDGEVSRGLSIFDGPKD